MECRNAKETEGSKYFTGLSNGAASPKLKAECRKGIKTKYQLYNRVEKCMPRGTKILLENGKVRAGSY